MMYPVTLDLTPDESALIESVVRQRRDAYESLLARLEDADTRAVGQTMTDKIAQFNVILDKIKAARS